MGLSIENITTQNDYVSANTFGQGTPMVAGWFIVANAVCAVRLTTGLHGQPSKQEEVACPPGIYPIQSNPKNPITTIEFRSFVAGSPAQIIGAVFYPSDSFIQSGGSFDAQITPGGGVTPPASSGMIRQSLDQITAPVSVTATTEGTADLVIAQAAPYVASGSQAIYVHFQAGRVNPPAGSGFIVLLLLDGVTVLGRIGVVTPPVGPGLVTTPVSIWTPLTPAAGSHSYSVRAFVNAGTGAVTVGAGGSGQELPGNLEVFNV